VDRIRRRGGKRRCFWPWSSLLAVEHDLGKELHSLVASEREEEKEGKRGKEGERERESDREAFALASQRTNLISVTEISFALKCTTAPECSQSTFPLAFPGVRGHFSFLCYTSVLAVCEGKDIEQVAA